MALLQDAMETRDAVALAHAWACAAPGDDAERVGDALSLAVLGGLDAAAAGDIGACAAVRLRALDAPADDDDGDGGCAAVLDAPVALTRGAERRRGARRARRGARRGARAAAAGRARGRGGRGAALRGAARRAPRDAPPAPAARGAGRFGVAARARAAIGGALRDGGRPRARRRGDRGLTPPPPELVGDASFWRRDWERNARVVAAAGSAATLRASTTAPARGARRAPPAAGPRPTRGVAAAGPVARDRARRGPGP
ncbi:histone demethylase [Aureococcus anophagefferens]|nr:histone demethylase [Aureococcus anophagefferens]